MDTKKEKNIDVNCVYEKLRKEADELMQQIPPDAQDRILANLYMVFGVFAARLELFKEELGAVKGLIQALYFQKKQHTGQDKPKQKPTEH